MLDMGGKALKRISSLSCLLVVSYSGDPSVPPQRVGTAWCQVSCSQHGSGYSCQAQHYPRSMAEYLQR